MLEEGSKPHRYAGYPVASIIRLLWGWSVSITPASGQWWPNRPGPLLPCQLCPGAPPHYLGHNPVGSPDDPLLLLSLVGTVVTGWLTTWDASGRGWHEELPASLANTLMAAVGIHAAVVLDRSPHPQRFGPRYGAWQKRVPANIKVEDPCA